MHKKIMVLFFAALCTGASAQTQDQKAAEADSLTKEVITAVEELKSGNYKDIFNSFFQFAAKDFASKHKSLGFNTTLFAVKLKADPTLLRDYNLEKQTFARNFQMNFKVNLDSSYNLNGFTAGLMYALVNKRDHQLARFNTGYINQKFNIEALSNAYFSQLRASGNDFIRQVVSTPAYSQDQKRLLLDSLNRGLAYLNRTSSPDSLPQLYRSKFQGQEQSIMAQLNNIKAMRDSAFSEIDKSWLWTMGINGITDKFNRFSTASLNTVVLKGKKPELDVRGTLAYTDTLISSYISRLRLNSTAGLNFTLASTGNKPLLEFKAYMEYMRILMHPLAGEEKDSFLANADLRFRLTDKIWIPLTIKYDIKQSNFLGFLNVSFNMSAFQSNPPSSHNGSDNQ